MQFGQGEGVLHGAWGEGLQGKYLLGRHKGAQLMLLGLGARAQGAALFFCEGFEED